MFNNVFTLFTQETAQPTDNKFLFIILAVFLVAMFAFTIIPQRRKQRNMLEMSSRIRVGDKIKTAGGIFGTITAFNEDTNTFTIVSGTSTFEIDRAFVYSMEMLGFKPTSADAVEEVEPIIEDDILDAAMDDNSVEEVKAEDTDITDNKNN